MVKTYNEVGITWSSIEKYYDYSQTIWSVDKNGIPKYVLLNKNGNKIDISC